jgi:hypothetical protein
MSSSSELPSLASTSTYCITHISYECLHRLLGGDLEVAITIAASAAYQGKNRLAGGVNTIGIDAVRDEDNVGALQSN